MVVKIKWNRSAFRALRTSAPVERELLRRAQKIRQAAGQGYEADSGITGGRGRARAAVWTATNKARIDNGRNQTLLRALDAGRR